MFIDEVTITVRAGNGGNGAATFRRSEGNPRGGPDGGNGGNGGNVYFQGVNDMTALQPFQHKKSVKADDGVAGKHKNLFGKNAEDLIVLLPTGTVVTVEGSTEQYEIAGIQGKLLIARGGKGGRGNNEFKSATNQAPTYAEKGEPGEEKIVHLELKLIAEIGLIGLPNAGKSSLLSVLTNASPKIGDYPFTTLEPNLGVMSARNAMPDWHRFGEANADRQSVAGGDGVIIADIPGLIEGASTGKGLGIKFLKHIERTKLLVHCIDSTSDDVVRDYKTVRNEFSEYNKELLEKPEIVLLTKSDSSDETLLAEKKKALEKVNKNVLIVSVYDDESLTRVQKSIISQL